MTEPYESAQPDEASENPQAWGSHEPQAAREPGESAGASGAPTQIRKVTSVLYAPIVGAVYILMLPVWALITLVQWGSQSPNRVWLMLGAAVVCVAAVPVLLKGIMMLRQVVIVDATGVTLRGLGGFSVPWGAMERLSTQNQRTANLVLSLREPVTSDFALGRSATRRIGVEAQYLDAILELAVAHGVTVEAPCDRPGRPASH